MCGVGFREVGGEGFREVGGVGFREVGGLEFREVGGLEFREVGSVGFREVGGLEFREVGGLEFREAGGVGFREVGGLEFREVSGVGFSDNNGAGLAACKLDENFSSTGDKLLFPDDSCSKFRVIGFFIGDDGVEDKLPSLGSELSVLLFDFFFGFPTSSSTPSIFGGHFFASVSARNASSFDAYLTKPTLKDRTLCEFFKPYPIWVVENK